MQHSASQFDDCWMVCIWLPLKSFLDAFLAFILMVGYWSHLVLDGLMYVNVKNWSILTFTTLKWVDYMLPFLMIDALYGSMWMWIGIVLTSSGLLMQI